MRISKIEHAALRKPMQIDFAQRIEDLRAAPANQLEQRKDRCAGQPSLLIIDQFRICFR